MRNLFFATALLLLMSSPASSQFDMDQVMTEKVNKLKKTLPSLKGKARIDCLNDIAEAYYWIWDDGVPYFLDTLCAYANTSLKEATKLKYKKGIAYANLALQECAAGYVRSKENRKLHEKVENYAAIVIKMGEELKDYTLLGRSYYNLAHMEKWNGERDKFQGYTVKAIEALEKAKSMKPDGSYQPIKYADCADCRGSEYQLAILYFDRSGFAALKDKPNYFEEARINYSKAGDLSGVGRSYQGLANYAAANISLPVAVEHMNKAIEFFRQDKNPVRELECYVALCAYLWNLGDFENGLAESRNTVLVAQKMIKRNDKNAGDSSRLGQAYYWLGRFYSIAGDIQTAFMYMRAGRPFYPVNAVGHLNNWAIGMAELHRLAGDYDSAKYYLKPYENHETWGKPIFANLYISLKEYDKALSYINPSLENASTQGDALGPGRMLFLASKAHLGNKNYQVAAEKGRLALNLLTKTKRSPYLMEQYEVMADIFNKLGKNDSAYYYLKMYTSLKDSLLSRQFYFRLNDYKKEAEELKRTSHIQLLQKDLLLKQQLLEQEGLFREKKEAEILLLASQNELQTQQLALKEQELGKEILLKQQNESLLKLTDHENKLKDERLKQQSFIKKALLAGLFMLLLLAVFIIRNLSLKRKNEKLVLGKKQTELQQKASMMEMQALRAQMNPHFIFNCLTSINRFILKNETGPASDYLTRFSRLIRMVLINSKKQLISLEDELEMLKLYLDMERLRFKNSFDYQVIFTNTVDAHAVSVPPLILQPFCENAIWHGLMNKEGQGKLEIHISMKNEVLSCIITDNGIGREMASLLKTKTPDEKKSVGLKITADRLSLLKSDHKKSFYEIEDLRDENGEPAGTKVVINIINQEVFEEYA